MELLKRSTNFKPIYLWTDESQIKTMLEQRENTAQEMTAAVIETEKLIERVLTTNEKEMVLIKRWDGVVHLLRLKTGFPKAEEAALLGLLGLDSGKCKEALNSIKRPFLATEFAINKNSIVVDPSFKESLEKQHTYYSNHERQNKALAIANDLSIALNRAVNANLVPSMDRPVNEHLNHGHDYLTPLKGLVIMESGNIVPNVREISRIKE